MKRHGELLLRAVLAILVLAFVARNLTLSLRYGAATLDRVGSMTQLPQWTNSRVVSQLDALKRSGPRRTIISTASNGIVARFEAASLTGRPLLFFSPYLGRYRVDAEFNINGPWAAMLGKGAFRAALTQEIRDYGRLNRHPVSFVATSWGGTRYSDEFFLDPRLREATRHPAQTLLLESFNPTLFNHWTEPGRYDPRVRLEPYGDARDLLVYVPSARGAYDTRPSTVMLSRFETDFFDGSKSMAGIGRYLLFHVVKPSPRFRVALSFSSTLMGEGKTAIPPASVIGATGVRFAVAGHGAARLFSPLLAPRAVDGLQFIAVDMGRDGSSLPERRRGIMKLFGGEYPIDSRKLVGFVRDISVVSDAQYRSLHAPQIVSAFPRGLEDPNLEFSGLYEDGWMADRAVLWLSAPKSRPCTLSLRATASPEAFRSVLHATITLDGKVVAAAYPPPGDLVMQAPVHCDGRRHEIGIAAGPVFNLPGGDGRPATMRLKSVGFER